MTCLDFWEGVMSDQKNLTVSYCVARSRVIWGGDDPAELGWPPGVDRFERKNATPYPPLSVGTMVWTGSVYAEICLIVHDIPQKNVQVFLEMSSADFKEFLLKDIETYSWIPRK